jgi:RimJ/RimL family protein N-acetyltransferase
MTVTLKTSRLTLRPFTHGDLNDFAALHADAEVMHDLGGPITRRDAAAKLTGYIANAARHGYGRWAVFHGQVFAGYVGILHHDDPAHPLGPHDEIGWRLHQAFWGQGVASEAAHAALTDAVGRLGLTHVLAYTAPDNLRSQAVMARLGLERAPDMDFEEPYAPVGIWHGMVWRVPQAGFAGGME